MNSIEDVFDEKKLKKSMRKAKIKSTIRVIIIVLMLLIIGYVINIYVCIKFSEKAYERNEAYVKLTVPDGYISKSDDIFGLLGGAGIYKIAKDIMGKSVMLEERVSLFGVNPIKNLSRMSGGSYFAEEEWPVNLWENGSKKMYFFHPELNYPDYQNDLSKIDSIPEDKIIEMAISFDRPYKINEFYIIESELRSIQMTWLWLNEFTEEQMNDYRATIENSDSRVYGIIERDTIGITHYNNRDVLTTQEYSYKYKEVIENLAKSYSEDHKRLAQQIIEEGETSAEEAEILGVVVQGTKEQLKELQGNEFIKATSFGVVTDKIY